MVSCQLKLHLLTRCGLPAVGVPLCILSYAHIFGGEYVSFRLAIQVVLPSSRALVFFEFFCFLLFYLMLAIEAVRYVSF